MSIRARTLPLGVDVGQSRVRVALVERATDAQPKLLAVAAQDHHGDPIAALGAALSELQTRERRCVLALSLPDAVVRSVSFPPMTANERHKAARFEAARSVDYPIGEAAVSLVSDEHDDRWVLAIARRAALASAIRIARRSRLRPIAVDDTAFAFQRAHPNSDGVIDVGEVASSLVIFRRGAPWVTRIPTGGAHFRSAIAAGLGIDEEAAERRKRLHGFGGAGTACRDEWLAAMAAAIGKARSSGHADIQRLSVCGNGSRIPDLAEALGHAGGCTVAPATFPPETSDLVPADVLRAAAPDWSLAFGLALWDSRG